MTKSKLPLLSLSASGTIADSITYQRRGSTNFARQKPIPTDIYSLKQAYQRWLYQDYVAWWHQQSAATKQLWETNARPFHMTGFAYWMSDRLTTMPDIAGYWKLDTLVGAKTPDSSPNANTGTVIGGSPSSLVIDGAVYLDGSDDYITFGAADSLNLTSAITLMLFWRPKTHDPYDMLVSKARWNLYSYHTTFGRPICNNWINGAWRRLDFSPQPVGVTHHLAFTYDENAGANNHRAYTNGLLVDSGTEVGPILATPTDPAILGCVSPGLSSKSMGTADHLIMLNRALTPADILRHSQRRYPP